MDSEDPVGFVPSARREPSSFRSTDGKLDIEPIFPGSTRRRKCLATRPWLGSVPVATPMLLILFFSVPVDGFGMLLHPRPTGCRRSRSSNSRPSSFTVDEKYLSIPCQMTSNKLDQQEEDFDGEIGDDAILLEDLNWRVAKQRLEEQNTKRFLKSKPRFLPYEECCKWVQAWGQRWQSEQEWRDWIAMGEKRNSYIPSQPDEYYGRLGHWVSWEHFLGVEKE